MARLSEIRQDPSTYLGSTTNHTQDQWDYQFFIEAVEALMVLGVDEQTALDTAWAGGDFCDRCRAIVNDPAAFIS